MLGWFGTKRPQENLKLGFYNNNLMLPDGLQFADDLVSLAFPQRGFRLYRHG